MWLMRNLNAAEVPVLMTTWLVLFVGMPLVGALVARCCRSRR